MTHWNDALCDVRKAYRLVAAYQERVARTIQALSAEFPSHRYYTWAPLQIDRLITKGKAPHLDRSPWDALPLYHYSVLLLPRGADPMRIRKGQCMIEFNIETDTSFDIEDDEQLGPDGHPDPAKLVPAADSGSALRIVGWFAEKTPYGGKSWFDDLWMEHDWPDEAGHVKKLEGECCSSFMMRCPLNEVFGAPDLAVFATRFKKAFADKTNVRV